MADRTGRQQASIVAALAVTLPGLIVGLSALSLAQPAEALIYGVAIIGAAFLLAWAAEVAQLDVSAGLAVGVLALIAVLPEYSVDLVFAGKGGTAVERFGTACQSPADAARDVESACSLALANMTGANRLLIGVGWPMVVFVGWLAWRRRGERRQAMVLERTRSVEVAYLTAACAYSLTLPLRRTLTVVDAVVLVAIFAAYTVRVARAPAQHPELIGPAQYLGTLPQRRRRVTVVVLFVAAAAVIVATAEHFAEALVETGLSLGVSEFFLVQWMAPLASELPELLIAGMYAWRLKESAGLGLLVSSKVNQWTLLVGTLPLAFAITSAGLDGLPIDSQQREELFLTAAQSTFAVAVLANLSLSTVEAMALFGLFWAQFAAGALLPDSAQEIQRIGLAVVYLAVAALLFLRRRRQVRRLLSDGFRATHEELAGGDPV